ncbi:MAG: Zn-ribbon domain-containing OB-fold protein [Microthrixaceae bacterium]
MDTSAAASEVLTAPLVIEYPVTRTTGPVVGAFLTGLRERVLIGIRGSHGQVIVPPTEYDPATAEELTELVEVGPGGVVDLWCWVRSPMPKHPLQRPFAWALVRPDGADVGFLQAVDAGSPEVMSVGLRVRPRWAEARDGSIHDLACWEVDA